MSLADAWWAASSMSDIAPSVKSASVAAAFSTATASRRRRTQQINAASAAVLLIARQIGRDAALVVLWDAFERVAATAIEEEPDGTTNSRRTLARHD